MSSSLNTIQTLSKQPLHVSDMILNDFYIGLKYLIDFETDNAHGVMQSEFFALNKIIAHLDSACEQGNLLAPFFLHYIANTYPNFIERDLLPDLATIPAHKSRAESWIQSYQQFLKLYQEIQKLKTPTIVYASNKKEADRLLKWKTKKIKALHSKLAGLCASNAIGGVLSAKLYQKLEEITHQDFSKLIHYAFNTAATYPDVFGIYSYGQFLASTNSFDIKNKNHQKLRLELATLKESKGNIPALTEHYQATDNLRYLSQWRFQAAIHGDLESTRTLMYLYIDDKMPWYHEISKYEKLEEAIKLFNFLLKHSDNLNLAALFNISASRILEYKTYISGDLNKAIFLALQLNEINNFLLRQSKHYLPEEFLETFSNLFATSWVSKDIIYQMWLLNGNEIPNQCISEPFFANELAIQLETLGRDKDAEKYYRSNYLADPTNEIYRYNLANILEKLHIEPQLQIELHLPLAENGAVDSILALYRICVTQEHGSTDDLKYLQRYLDKVTDPNKLPYSRQLLSFYLNIAIFEKVTGTKIVEWNPETVNGIEIFKPRFITIETDPLDESPSELAVDMDGEIDDKNEKSSLDIVKPEDEPITAKLVSSNTSLSHPSTLFANESEVKTSATASSYATTLSQQEMRAMRILENLNEKGIRQLTTKDFISAQKAYNILIGDGGGISISNKGKTSGSRVNISGKNLHLTHGRDRPSIGAQSEIRDEISAMYEEVSSSGKPVI